MVPAPINIKLSSEIVDYVIQDSGCKLAFIEDEFLHLVPDGLPTIRFGVEFDDFLDHGPFSATQPASGTVALQPYTSGSTGRPKGVLLDHAGQMWGPSIGKWMRPDGAYLVAAPLYHKNALMVTKSAFYAGSQIVLMPRFDAKTYLKAVERFRPDTISGVPAMITMLMLEKDAIAQTD
ncbi:MAG: AMP-binding protein, partial [Alphaproteobacteria bacterium]